MSADELTPELVRELFRRLDREPAVLYQDEIDHIGRPKSDWRHDPESRQTLIALLAAIDGLRSESGLLVVASSTDPPSDIDEALLQDGSIHVVPLSRGSVHGWLVRFTAAIRRTRVRTTVPL